MGKPRYCTLAVDVAFTSVIFAIFFMALAWRW